MTELKTLKDIEIWYTKFDNEKGEFPEESQEMIDRKQLKAEAVKWVKELEILNENRYKQLCLNCMNIQNDTYECWKKGHFTTESDWEECGDLSAIIWFIKNFFNLTEEELK